MLLTAYVNMNKVNREDMWFLDSGCSNHMCGNNSSMVVTGKSNVRLQVNGIIPMYQSWRTICWVLGNCNQRGLPFCFKMERARCFILRGLIIETRMHLNRIFVLHAISQPVASTCFYTITKYIEQLWHCRYGRLSSKRRLWMVYHSSNLLSSKNCAAAVKQSSIFLSTKKKKKKEHVLKYNWEERSSNSALSHFMVLNHLAFSIFLFFYLRNFIGL